jgi:hypothetical protein
MRIADFALCFFYGLIVMLAIEKHQPALAAAFAMCGIMIELTEIARNTRKRND